MLSDQLRLSEVNWVKKSKYISVKVLLAGYYPISFFAS